MKPSFLHALNQSWFLIALILVLGLGQWQAANLLWLADLKWLRLSVVVCVIFIMALGVPLADILKQVARPYPTLLASTINMLFMPVAAWLIGFFLPMNLAGGFVVAAAIPCTLASAAVWTRRAGGEDSIAMLVMLITNLTCFFVTPLWLLLLLGQKVELDVGKLISELFLLVLIPSVLAQFLRYHLTSVARFATRYKVTLSTVAQFGILLMVLLGSIQMSQSSSGIESQPSSRIYIPYIQSIIAAVVLHSVALAMGWYAAVGLNFNRREQIGVAISGSQKTLMVGLQVCIDCGVSILPMVLYHISQLLIDTFLADWWARHGRKLEQEKKP
jgi:sodium/bile acid cotransporter 7